MALASYLWRHQRDIREMSAQLRQKAELQVRAVQYLPSGHVLLAAALDVASPAATPADEKVVAPRGKYAGIDVRLANETIAALMGEDEGARSRATHAVEAAPEKYAPPVFYVLSSVLFASGRKDDAAFWFYAGQLRGRFDANRCADVSARQAIAVLNDQFGPPINLYMFKDTDAARLQALIPKVVDWDRKTPHEYDHRWINLHGMTAMIESLDTPAGKPEPLSLPRAQWDAIAEKTRTDYVEGLKQAVAMVKKKRAAMAASAATAPAPAGWERGLVGSWKQELSSVLRDLPQSLPGMKPGEEGRREAAERFRLEWTMGPDTLAIVNPMVAADRRSPPMRYKVLAVQGNVATLELTPAEGPPFEWKVEYLERDAIRLVGDAEEEVYRLRRSAAAPPR